ncbi:MAG TPA: hypothetical protein VLM37_07765, partial [Fibrobacteraceae bacterium]|nr:hypothetical protein [Fibrobacteraceae bacterium]
MSNTNLTVARIRIQNTSSEPITGVRLEYYYTAWNCGLTSTPERYWTDSAAVWAEQGADTTDCYLIIDLENDTLPSGEWFPNESGWSIGLHDSAWTTWSKSNDFSQPESSAFATTNHIAVFVNDTLVQGSQPSGHAPWNWRDVRIQSFTPGAPDSCRVELVNRGSATVSLAGAVLRSHTDTLCVFADSVSLDSGEALTLWPERVDSLRAGELWLEWNGRMGAYVQWGVLDSTVGYADAILQGAWKGGWVSTRRTSYTEGDFFGILAWEDGDAPDEWNRYTATEAEQAQAGTLPTPVLHQHSGNLYLMPGDSTLTLHLGWDIVAGVDSYTVVIAADTAFTDTLQTIETTSTSATLTLDTGNTSIRVVARKINWTTLTAIVTGDPITTLVVDVWTSDDDDGEVLLTKDSIAAEKDTRMLVPEFSYDSSSFWDSPTSLSDSEWDPEIGGRCSFVALEHLNHYYGGDVTQDEIKFFVKGGFPLYNGIYPEWAPYLYHPASSYNDGGNYPETFIAATWLLGGTFQENWASHNYFLDTLKDSVVIMDHFQVDQMVLTGKNLLYYGTGAPPWDTIQSCIFEGNPIVVFTENPDHAQTIVGCLDSGAIWVHNGTLGANNGGVLAYDTSKYFHGSDSIVAYFYVKDASQVTPRKGNSLIANETDSDGDGVLDFDEIYRFKTNPYSTDTDSDGVSDKAEIASYSIYRTLNQAAMLDSSLLMPDIDGDSLRAERDPDADGGGLIDGSEDLDHDGVLDTDETSPYDSTDDAAVLAAAGLDDYALVAFGTLRLNDGVQCL